MRSHCLKTFLEMIAVYVRTRTIVGECFYQHELVGIVQALRPFEEDIARFLSCGFCELTHGLRPAFDRFRLDVEFYGDEVHMLPFIA